MADIVKYKNEKKQYERDIENASSQLRDFGGGRSLEDMQADLKKLREEIHNLQAEIQTVSIERENRRQQIATFDKEVSSCKEKLVQIQHTLEKTATLRAQIEEHVNSIQRAQRTIEEAEREIGELAPQISKLQTRMKAISEEGSERENKQQKEASKLADSVNQLKSIDDEIRHYLLSGNSTKLEYCQEEIRKYQTDVAKAQADAAEVTRDINKYQDEKANTLTTEQNIKNNLTLREDKRVLAKVLEEIAELESRNAEVDRERFTKQAKAMSIKHTRLTAEQADIAGEMRSKDKELAEMMREYEIDFRDSKDKYREAMIKVTTTKAAIEDLTKYGAALDKAVMKYHSLKMEEINRIIEELWKATYRGTDVDTILIRSDNETQKGNRSYNYRVCMVKQDAELDMRGRCSAGQKVLASIIIRLALAECFGVNCGVSSSLETARHVSNCSPAHCARRANDQLGYRQHQVTGTESLRYYPKPQGSVQLPAHCESLCSFFLSDTNRQ